MIVITSPDGGAGVDLNLIATSLLTLAGGALGAFITFWFQRIQETDKHRKEIVNRRLEKGERIVQQLEVIKRDYDRVNIAWQSALADGRYDDLDVINSPMSAEEMSHISALVRIYFPQLYPTVDGYTNERNRLFENFRSLAESGSANSIFANEGPALLTEMKKNLGDFVSSISDQIAMDLQREAREQA